MEMLLLIFERNLVDHTTPPDRTAMKAHSMNFSKAICKCYHE